MVARAPSSSYALRTVPMIWQRGGITTAYLIFDAGRLVKAFRHKDKALRFFAKLQGR
jgi:hypothetical protein